MQAMSITHPHAQTAVLLASFNQPDREYVNATLAESGTPRCLYTLARLLRAAQLMDEINAAPACNEAAPLEPRSAFTRFIRAMKRFYSMKRRVTCSNAVYVQTRA